MRPEAASTPNNTQEATSPEVQQGMERIAAKINAKLDAKTNSTEPNIELQNSYKNYSEHFRIYQVQVSRFAAADYHTTPEEERQKHIEEYTKTKKVLKETLKADVPENTHPSLKVFRGIVTDFVELFDTHTTQKDGTFHLSDKAKEISAQSQDFFGSVKEEFKSLEAGFEKSLRDCQQSISNLSKKHPALKECFKTATKVITEEVMDAVRDDEDFLKYGSQIAGGIMAATGNPGNLALLSNPYVIVGVLAAAVVFGLLFKLFGGKKSNDKGSNVDTTNEEIPEEKKDDLTKLLSMLLGFNQEEVEEKKAPTASSEAAKGMFEDIRAEMQGLKDQLESAHKQLESTQKDLTYLTVAHQALEEKLKTTTPEEQKDAKSIADKQGIDLETTKSAQEKSDKKAEEFVKPKQNVETSWVDRVGGKSGKTDQQLGKTDLDQVKAAGATKTGRGSYEI
jgi:hypothetical protein